MTEANQPVSDARLVVNRLPLKIAHSGLAWYTFFGQFLAHDMGHTGSAPYGTCTCESDDPECFNINLSSHDENTIAACTNLEGPTSPSDCEIDLTIQTCMPFSRSADVERVFKCNFKNREQFTRGTHFIDLDNLYGSTLQGQRQIRSYNDGELKYDVSKQNILRKQYAFNKSNSYFIFL